MNKYRSLKVSVLITLVLTTIWAWSTPSDCRRALLKSSTEANDPMPADGAYAGQMVENNKGRTLKILNVEEKLAFGIDPSVIAFANFRHLDQFYIAHISGIKVDDSNRPLSSDSVVQSVRVLSEHWEALTNPPLAPFESHSYLHFTFKDGQGIQLDFNQSTNATVTTPTVVSTAVLSTEALRPQSDPTANFMPHAFVFDFAIGHLFYSAIDRANSELADTGKVEDRFELGFEGVTSRNQNLSDPKDALVFAAIQSSQEYGRTQAYNFVINNCTNRMFDVLDGALVYKAGFDKPAFVADVTVALDADIPPALTYLKATIAKYGTSLPASILTKLGELSPDQITPTLIRDATQSQNPSEFQTWFPPFVKAHLIGRGLIAAP